MADYLCMAGGSPGKWETLDSLEFAESEAAISDIRRDFDFHIDQDTSMRFIEGVTEYRLADGSRGFVYAAGAGFNNRLSSARARLEGLTDLDLRVVDVIERPSENYAALAWVRDSAAA